MSALGSVAEETRDRLEVHDPEFAAVLGGSPRLVKVVDVDAHEGPVYRRSEDTLYFTTLPRLIDPTEGSRSVAIKRVQLNDDRFPVEPDAISVLRASTNMTNGMTLTSDGRLAVCEQGTYGSDARIGLVDPRTGEAETLVDGWNGLPFNSPNDVVQKNDGTFWFTDPSYGHLQGFRPAPEVGDYVYRYDRRTRRADVVVDSMDKPNGLAFSPDESVLYVGDSGANQEPGSYYVDRPHHILAFDIVDGCHLVNERLFTVTTPGFPDGIKVDAAGRVYASSSSGVQVFNPLGDLIGEICLPGAVNFAFGGTIGRTLFITTDSAVWALILDPAVSPLIDPIRS